MKALAFGILMPMILSAPQVKPAQVNTAVGDTLYIETHDGNVWAWEDPSSEMFDGDNCALMFSRKGTITLYDDEIVRVIGD